jgi:hypothetical protein
MMREKTGRSGFEQNRVVHSKIYALFGDDFIPDVNLLQLRALELGGENRQGSVAESGTRILTKNKNSCEEYRVNYWI